MSKEFDFEHVGKRMPYTAPDGFLDDLESNVLERIQQEAKVESGVRLMPDEGKASPRKPARLRMWARVAVAMAACTALFVAISAILLNQGESGIDDVETAFCQLSPDDQTFLLDVYQDELFFYE